MIHCLSEDVHRAAFWRFADGTIFRLGSRVYKKKSCFTATYLDKLHGETIEYFNPFRQFTYVGRRTEKFPGTVVDDDAMKVILTDRPEEYRVRLFEYLDGLREQVEAEGMFLVSKPNFTAPPAALNSLGVSRFALVFDVVLLPCHVVATAYRHGVPAARRFLWVYPSWFKSVWKIARWDFWNSPTPKPFYHPPANHITSYTHYRWNPTTGRYEEFK